MPSFENNKQLRVMKYDERTKREEGHEDPEVAASHHHVKQGQTIQTVSLG